MLYIVASEFWTMSLSSLIFQPVPLWNKICNHVGITRAAFEDFSDWIRWNAPVIQLSATFGLTDLAYADDIALLRDSFLAVECIQRLVTCMVRSVRKLPYEGRIRQLNLFSFETSSSLAHFPRTPWLPASGVLRDPSGAEHTRAWLQGTSSLFPFTLKESSQLC